MRRLRTIALLTTIAAMGCGAPPSQSGAEESAATNSEAVVTAVDSKVATRADSADALSWCKTCGPVPFPVYSDTYRIHVKKFTPQCAHAIDSGGISMTATVEVDDALHTVISTTAGEAVKDYVVPHTTGFALNFRVRVAGTINGGWAVSFAEGSQSIDATIVPLGQVTSFTNTRLTDSFGTCSVTVDWEVTRS